MDEIRHKIASYKACLGSEKGPLTKKSCYWLIELVEKYQREINEKDKLIEIMDKKMEDFRADIKDKRSKVVAALDKEFDL